MLNIKKFVIALLCSCAALPSVAGDLQKNVPVDFSHVKINDSFWLPLLHKHASVTIPACLRQCQESTQRVKNFAIAAGLEKGEFKGIFYDDSDLYKMIEGCAYTLINHPDEALEARLDLIIDTVAAAQRPDGYLNTYYTLVEPNGRWTNMDRHEMYCAGHLIEAAVAYHRATGKRKLLDVAIRFADYLDSTFGPGKRHWVPGHQEIELALAKLYSVTGEKRYLDLAHWLLEERGRGHGDWSNCGLPPEHYMDVVPASRLEKVTGHGVRAMYQLTGMADVAALSGDTAYIGALDRLWDNIIGAKMYATGGICNINNAEGFAEDFDLPNKEAYCETCASIGMCFWNQRMNALKGEARYIDVLERALYNGVIDGISLSADHFFYVNPLESDGGHHRQPWYDTACCPSNLSRFLPSIGNYIYATSPGALWLNLYIGNDASFNVDGNPVEVSVRTLYPRDGHVDMTLSPEKSRRFSLRLRRPDWARDFSVKVNGKSVKATQADGYLCIDRKWKKGDKVTVDMPMPVEVCAADPRVKNNEGKRYLRRGPVVYCMEGIDNPSYAAASLSPATEYTAAWNPGLLGGCTVITAREGNSSLTFIPYHLWDNRDPCPMKVWVDYMEQPRQPARADRLLNFGWRYNVGDEPDAKNPSFDDSGWQMVNVPHDGSIHGAFDKEGSTQENGFRPRHKGWYRKSFTLPADDIRGKRVALEFEGVYRDAEVWVNGEYLGKQPNGYMGFTYDITDHVIPDKENVVAVRYDNTYVSSRWYTGEGIYRNVWLRVKNPVSIAENGTYITTPYVDDKKAAVAVQTEVVNRSDSARLVTLKTDIYSPAGKLVKSVSAVAPVAAGASYTFRQEAAVDNPSRWDIDSPELYTVKSTLSSGNETIDEYDTNFGIRTVEFDPERGFVLNGRKVFLKGVNLHHDLGPLGSAFFEKGMRRRLEGIKKMGCNAVRLAHNPHAKAVLDLCDEMGILVFADCFDKWDTPTWNHYGPGISFDDYWRKDLEWTLRRDRNHPSIFIWSVGNEVFDTGTIHRMDEYFVPMLKNMVDFVHKFEPSRKVTCGLFPARGESEPVPMAFEMDVVSDNYMANYYARDHAKFPQLIFLQSETSTRNGGDDFFIYDHTYPCGQFYWGGTDYFGESIQWPAKGWNGIIDWCDFWKPLSYFVQSVYSDKDMVKIAASSAGDTKSEVMWNNVALNFQDLSMSWNWKENQPLDILTITNADEVELYVNGESQGIKQLKDFPNHKIPWQLDFRPGTIKAVARKAGKEVAVDEIKTAGKPHSIVLSTDSTSIRPDGMDLAYITVSVVDKDGVLVPYADNSIRFSVEGAGELAAVGNGDRNSDEAFDADNRKAYQGKCLAIVRSTTLPGKIKVKASAKGLKPATLLLTAEQRQ